MDSLRKICCPILVLVLVSWSPIELAAQSIRYDLGQRLRRFEAEFEKDLSLDQRAKAMKPMQRAVQKFFSGQLDSAAERLDDAWVSLLPSDQKDIASWSASLQIVPETSLLVAADQFQFRIRERYTPATLPPDQYRFVCQTWLLSEDGQASEHEDSFAKDTKILFAKTSENAQYQVRVFVESDHQRFPIGEIFVSRIDDFEARISALETAAAMNRQTWQKSARATVRQQTKLLRRLVAKNDVETNIPARFELQRIESLTKHADQGEWLKNGLQELKLKDNDASPIGCTSFWMKLVGDGRKSMSVRAWVPDMDLDTESKVPCLVAIHGAGGSENMFFDAYGDGKVLKLCRERGWILIAPKIGMAGSGLVLHEAVAQLAEQLPIDTDKIFIVGHSMGAGYAMSSVQNAREDRLGFRYRAVAPIGGGRPIQIANPQGAEKLATRFFVSAGDSDFGMAGAEALHSSLERQELNTRFKSYEATEHMAVVQIALKDVFAFFDESLKEDR